ncbi:MAG: queuosine precursor transporter [Cytophagales bacterium]
MEIELRKKDKLFLVLGGFFLTNALLAEIIGAKIFSLEQLLHLPPAQLSFFGSYVLDFNLTAGVLIWPVVFVVSDIINEYYGRKGVQIISFATAGFILFAFAIIYLSANLPPAQFWLDINNKDANGNNFDINFAFSAIFRQGLGIIAGSLTAFLLGQAIDATVFLYIRKLTGEKLIWLRATGSTVVSQLIDSFVVLLIAFHFFGNWSLDLVIAVGIMNFIYKITIALILIPFLYLSHFFIDRYLKADSK